MNYTEIDGVYPEVKVFLILALISSWEGAAAAAPIQSPHVVINEVAWMGTRASPADEWIELFNPAAAPVSLEGWTLRWGERVVALRGVIAARGFFLLERTDDRTVADVRADLIYKGGLRNGGEALRLLDARGALVDSANGDGGPWPAGDNAAKASMERIDPRRPDADANWTTFSGEVLLAHDADGHPIRGTPRAPNAGRKIQRAPPSPAVEALTPSEGETAPSPSPPPSRGWWWPWLLAVGAVVALAALVLRAVR